MTEYPDPSDDAFGLDPFDAELGARLRASAPTGDDVDGVLAAMRPRLARARRRRRTGFVAAGAAALALLAGVAFAVADTAPKTSVHVPPADRPTPAPGPDRRGTTPPTTAAAEAEPPGPATHEATSPPPGPSSPTPGTGSVVADDHGGSSDDASDDTDDDASDSGSSRSGSSRSGSSGSGSGKGSGSDD
jgi:hypothetical protein